MNLFEQMKTDGHEQILFGSDPASGLQAIIAIHDTRLGPSLGGCRMWPYPNFDAALTDVLRLSKAMTYKAAMADLPLGGGKSVIWGDPKKEKSEAKLVAFAEQVASLGGRYIVAEDVGIGLADIERIHRVMPHAAGLPEEKGGSGDPSPATAYGVFCGMRAALEERFGEGSFQGRKIAIQGIGKVGYALALLLHKAGAKISVCDMDPERVAAICKVTGADPFLGHEIYRVECDIFAPCALGGFMNERTIPRLSCEIVAGAANNQLENAKAAILLRDRNILYTPDYVLNAGGLINIAEELNGYSKERAYKKIEAIYDRLKEVFALAKKESIPPSEAADRLAEARLAGGRKG
ncbi:MAG: Glu/Leu/Phe/Val dehydrogenase [Candidatus Manganitrophaceae bacterium]|nr:MAG: Glu/Leu/Phe/Val dehydrogenase [Candidatus Manganitrophaceae bacterium]